MGISEKIVEDVLDVLYKNNGDAVIEWVKENLTKEDLDRISSEW